VNFFDICGVRILHSSSPSSPLEESCLETISGWARGGSEEVDVPELEVEVSILTPGVVPLLGKN